MKKDYIVYCKTGEGYHITFFDVKMQLTESEYKIVKRTLDTLSNHIFDAEIYEITND